MKDLCISHFLTTVWLPLKYFIFFPSFTTLEKTEGENCENSFLSFSLSPFSNLHKNKRRERREGYLFFFFTSQKKNVQSTKWSES